MVWLDCTNLGTAKESLAAALGTEVDHLLEVVHEYDGVRFMDTSEDPFIRMPREVVTSLGKDLTSISIEGTVFFHGTRLLESTNIRDIGLLPLGQHLESIWKSLFDLVRDECTPASWTKFRAWIEEGGGGHEGWLYRIKSVDERHHGPYGVLVRDTFFDPKKVGQYDYLGCPEIIQDISWCFQEYCKVDLEARFRAAARPIIVSFRSHSCREGLLRAALWYVFAMVRDGELTSNANECYEGNGQPVMPIDVIAVDDLE